MKIIISPSKTQKLENVIENSNETLSLSKKSEILFSKLKAMNKDELGKTLKISKTLLDKTYKFYQTNFKKLPQVRTIDCYSGVVFEQLELNKYNQEQFKYLNNHLVILSAMYGFLTPATIIYPYRLDMTNKIPGIQLYKFWQDSIDEYFNSEELIINLASDEFSKMLKNQTQKIVNIYFSEETKTKKLKVVSYNAKKARGKMLNYLVLNQCFDLEEIKKFNEDGYLYSEDLSDNKNYKFIKYYKK